MVSRTMIPSVHDHPSHESCEKPSSFWLQHRTAGGRRHGNLGGQANDLTYPPSRPCCHRLCGWSGFTVERKHPCQPHSTVLVEVRDGKYRRGCRKHNIGRGIKIQAFSLWHINVSQRKEDEGKRLKQLDKVTALLNRGGAMVLKVGGGQFRERSERKNFLTSPPP